MRGSFLLRRLLLLAFACAILVAIAFAAYLRGPRSLDDQLARMRKQSVREAWLSTSSVIQSISYEALRARAEQSLHDDRDLQLLVIRAYLRGDDRWRDAVNHLASTEDGSPDEAAAAESVIQKFAINAISARERSSANRAQ